MALTIFSGYDLITRAVDRVKTPKLLSPNHYKSSIQKKIYPHLSDKEVFQLLLETWGHPYQYNSYSGFKEKPRKGRFVNVGVHQFRHFKPQYAWPPDTSHFNIYLFGGSTTFGYGVEDEATIASFIQRKWRHVSGEKKIIAVYNYGQGSFISSQERALFIKLIQNGHKPDLAVFLDGLNDFSNFSGEPCVTFTEERYVGIKRVDFPAYVKSFRLASDILEKVNKLNPSRNNVPGGKTVKKPYTYMDAISKEFSVPVVFALHPIAAFKYSQKYHAFQIHPLTIGSHMIGYPLVSYLGSKGLFGNLFLDLSGIQDSIPENLYVDGYHFNRRFNGLIADEIVEFANQHIIPSG